MELKGDLHGLVEKAGALHKMINEEINKTSYGLLRLYSENGLYCGIEESPFRERQGLVAIRDSLKEVWYSLLLLQRLRNSQPKDRADAVARIEDSRLALVEKVSQYQGRQHHVVRELSTCFNSWKPSNQKTGSNQDLDPSLNQVGKKPNSGFWIFCLKLLLNPWRWKRSAGFAAKLAIIFATTLSICNAKQRRFTISHKTAGSAVFDVFHGRG